MRRQDDDNTPKPVTTTTTPEPDTTTTTPGSVTTTPAPPKQPPQTFYVPIFVLTALFGAMFIIGPLLVRKGPNSGITRCCIMISAFCMWIFWTTMYISQMNPLMGPRLHNASLAWLGHKWGKNPKSLAALEETP
ncbi:unnamed protein product [Spodoptera littoralis]|uniref:V-type proton ATPase subunit n=1 Tax=Spodoptera littoralis TaxID=7109 RepID=A0A9P0N5I5_SPOLI|nr:unnamed protein product [Spodoptera littoralis]CAH1645663.1 unnamed protein product [Spodoptera littoralis]